MIASGQSVDDVPIEQRSPSPEPTYNEVGVRTNTRELRIRDKLVKERTVRLGVHACMRIAWEVAWTLLTRRMHARSQAVITELIKKNPNYKPPSDYRPEKKTRRLHIPQEKYPGYNFIGLIIGPR